MIYLVVALRGEAKPLLAHWSLKRNKSVPQRLYENDEMALLVTQMGRENAFSALEAVVGRKKPGEKDVLINFGLCAAPPDYPIGSVLLAGELRCENESVSLETPCLQGVARTVLETVDEPFGGSCDHAVDMEAYGVYKSASGCFETGQIAFLKVVSDHFEPEGLDRDEALRCLKESIPLLEGLMRAMKGEADG